MRFPAELWKHPADRELLKQTIELFSTVPLVLTDGITNSVYFNDAAERLYGEEAEAIVNRAAWSLLGFDFSSSAPAGLEGALLGTADPWKGVVRVAGGATRFCEASAIRRGEQLVAGLIRFTGSESD